MDQIARGGLSNTTGLSNSLAKELRAANHGNKKLQETLRSNYHIYLSEMTDFQSLPVGMRDDADVAVASVSLRATEVYTEPPPKEVESAIQGFEAAYCKFGPASQKLQTAIQGLSAILNSVAAAPWWTRVRRHGDMANMAGPSCYHEFPPKAEDRHCHPDSRAANLVGWGLTVNRVA